MIRDQLFRKKALEKLSSPDELDQLLSLTNPKAWLVVIASAVLIIAGLAWAVFSTGETTVSASGLLYNPEAVYEASAPVDGEVVQVYAAPGDTVSSDDVLAEIVPAEVGAEIRKLQAKIASKDQSLDRAALQERLHSLKTSHEHRIPIQSGIDGRVLELRFNQGRLVSYGETIAVVENTAQKKKLTALLMAPVKYESALRKGQKVYLNPVSTAGDKRGYLLGEINSISSRGISDQALAAAKGLRAAAGNSTQPLLTVFVELKEDTGDASGFKWTIPNREAISLRSGTVCTGDIVVSSYRPVEKLFN